MARPSKLQIICANDLLSGDAIWLKTGGSWTADITQAMVLSTPEESAAKLKIAASDDRAIGAYLAEVEVHEQTQTPFAIHYREQFRTRGPSNYFHGKQAGH